MLHASFWQMEPTETESASNGRMGPRSRNGCWTCRARKVKCDEHRPRCHRCTRLDLVCDYSLRYKPGTKFVSKLENQPLPASPGESNGDGNRHVGAIVSRKLRNSLKHVQNWAAVSSLNQRLPVPLPALTNSACSLELQPADHEAIRYYHSTFARINNTKNPTYSIYSIIFNKAERDPMVMLMLLALSGHEMDHRKNGGVHDDATMVGRSMPPFLQHYCRALGLMRQAIQPPDKWPTVDLEAICINMLLMLIYEEKFGQANPKTLATYLNGAATILQCYFHGLRSINQISSPRRTRHAAASAAPGDANQPSNHQLTPFLAGLLNFLCIHDVSAMSFGIGGRVCAALQDLMQHVPNGNGIDIIHRYSYSVYGAAGIHDYPYSELLNDIEIRAVSVVYSQGLILRYMVAELELLKPAPEPGVVQCRIGDMYALIHNVEVSSSEVLTAACKLSASADNTRRSVASIRALVPQYLAALLDFQRLRIRLAQPPALEEVSAEENVQLIMDLAVQAHQYEGINAMVRIAWPLFMAAVETTNAVHLEWILSRFDDMGCFGKNYQRAYRFLSRYDDLQHGCIAANINIRAYFRTPGVEFFVL